LLNRWRELERQLERARWYQRRALKAEIDRVKRDYAQTVEEVSKSHAALYEDTAGNPIRADR
jgi:hypothetical protein